MCLNQEAFCSLLLCHNTFFSCAPQGHEPQFSSGKAQGSREIRVTIFLIPAAKLQVATPPAAPAATPTAAAPTTLEQKPIADTVHTHDTHMLSDKQ